MNDQTWQAGIKEAFDIIFTLSVKKNLRKKVYESNKQNLNKSAQP